MTSGETRLEIGRIGRAHGLRGDVGVKLTTERLERLTPGSVLHAGERDARRRRRAAAQRPLARALRGHQRPRARPKDCSGSCSPATPLPTGTDELWVHELIGLPVRDRVGRDLGRVVAVEANPASDLLVLDDDVLIPMTFVIGQGPDGVVVDPPEGLLDVNRRD